MIYFLSGLPRSGSTVLAAILNQNPLLYVTATSGLSTIMGTVVEKWETDDSMHVQGKDEAEIYRLLNGIVKAKYENVTKPIVIDKSRIWPNPTIMKTMTRVLGEQPKIIATVRNVPDCAASFVRVAKPENVQNFLVSSELIEHLKYGYMQLQEGMEKNPDCFCIVDYDDLLKKPQEQIQRIHDFLGLEPFAYDFKNIEGSVVAEKDEEVWNLPGLHDVKPILKKQHNETAQEVLGHKFHEFDQPKFWLGETGENRPKQLIDLQLEAGKRGDFQKAWEIALQLEKTEPDNNRAAYNRGLYVLMQGKLQEGMDLLSRGRFENVFGNAKPLVPTSIWRGEPNSVVLLYLEGGFGDQIHQMRFVKDIVSRGCRVVISCSASLLQMLSKINGVSAGITHEAVSGIYHDFWVPGMSTPLTLGIEYSDVVGSPYIEKRRISKNKKLRVGLRWQGNPNFEHEHNKYFDPTLLFNAVAGHDVEFVSLQRDEGAQHKPDWVADSVLNSWEDTQAAISNCDLVISSCTSVAHLSAAMGVQTWVVTPILPYYIWAIPGEKCPWYDSVRLFKQTKFNDWSEVFNKVSDELNIYLYGANYAANNIVR
jgi:hypothetical protein